MLINNVKSYVIRNESVMSSGLFSKDSIILKMSTFVGGSPDLILSLYHS